MSEFLKKYNFIYDNMASDMAKAGRPLNTVLKPGTSALEYGAGTGESVYRTAVEHPGSIVTGVDVHEAFTSVFERASKIIPDVPVPTNISFHNMGKQGGSYAITKDDPSSIDRGILRNEEYDFCFTWCVFEHVDITIIDDTLRDIFKTLKKGGLMYLKINPLFFSSRGAHISAFLPEPWAHLIYGHEMLKAKFLAAAEAAGNKQGALMWHQYETLNKITGDDLRDRILAVGFSVIYQDRLYEGKPPKSLESAYSLEALRNKDIVLICEKPA